MILVSIAGTLVMGVMARYSWELIRGHGISEAIEAIHINDSRIDSVALLKLLSAAISTGRVARSTGGSTENTDA